MNNLIAEFWLRHSEPLTQVEIDEITALINSPIDEEDAWAGCEVVDRWIGSFTLKGRTRRPRRCTS